MHISTAKRLMSISTSCNAWLGELDFIRNLIANISSHRQRSIPLFRAVGADISRVRRHFLCHSHSADVRRVDVCIRREASKTALNKKTSPPASLPADGHCLISDDHFKRHRPGQISTTYEYQPRTHVKFIFQLFGLDYCSFAEGNKMGHC